MRFIKYRVTLKHDSGKITIATVASNKKGAIEQVLNFENAPQSAVVKVERVKKTYKQLKNEARQKAIDMQNDIADKALSWWDVSQLGDYFEKLGKRYGLLKEFRENGII